MSRQHIHLFQGGPLDETVVENFKVRYRELLESGETAAVEPACGPAPSLSSRFGPAEIGTDQAGNILEPPAARRFTDDPLE